MPSSKAREIASASSGPRSSPGRYLAVPLVEQLRNSGRRSRHVPGSPHQRSGWASGHSFVSSRPKTAGRRDQIEERESQGRVAIGAHYFSAAQRVGRRDTSQAKGSGHSKRWQSKRAFEDGEGLRLLAPFDLQCIKAAGVTFAVSAIERVIEERARGDKARAEALRADLRERDGADIRVSSPVRTGSQRSRMR